jgi:isopenicillin-N epimerase
VPAAIDFQTQHDWPAHRARCHHMAWDTMQRVLAHNGLAPAAPQSSFGQMVTIPVRCADRVCDGACLNITTSRCR